jgi:putative transposase
MLADEGVYLASESSMARVLRPTGRTPAVAAPRHPRPHDRPPPHRHRARPGLVLGHDLPAGQRHGSLVPPVPDPGPVQPQDRGWEVHDSDDADHAVHLVRRTALAEGIASMHTKPVLHGDNGSTLKATTVLAMLHWLGVNPRTRGPVSATTTPTPSRCSARPSTAPSSPPRASPAWMRPGLGGGFVHWYNVEHRHSGIRYVTRQQRHAGEDRPSWLRGTRSTPGPRTQPGTLVRDTRNWSPVGAVTLNPERDAVVSAAADGPHTQQMAA